MPFDPSTAKPIDASGMFDPKTAKLASQPVSSDKSTGTDDLQASGARDLAGVLGQAALHVPSSAMNFARQVVQPVLHPIKTAESFGNLLQGLSNKTDRNIALSRGVPSWENGYTASKIPSAAYKPEGQDEKMVDALKQYAINRYGSIENFKKTLETDPVGLAADLSAVFTGGETALAKAPGILGKIGKVSGKIGEVTNPVSLATKGISKVAAPVGRGLAEVVGGLGTHTGAIPLKKAFEAGRLGGVASQHFLDNMRGNAPIENVVASAKNAVAQMRQEKNAAYQSGMAGVSKDKTILDFKPIEAELAKVSAVKNFKGQDLSKSTAGVRKQIADAIKKWKSLPAAKFHTPEGMDALKQQLGDIKDNLPYNSPQRLVADNAYNAVRKSITQQAPQYAKVMEDYSKASDLLSEIQRTLSLNPKASVDTALRKLQSIMRNNVNTNFGARASLGKTLTQHGAPNLEFQLAGQALNKSTPRGLGAVEAGIPVAASLMTHGNPLPLAALPFMSPRLMGETAHLMGSAGRYGAPVINAIPAGTAKIAPALYEAGSAQDILNNLTPN